MTKYKNKILAFLIVNILLQLVLYTSSVKHTGLEIKDSAPMNLLRPLAGVPCQNGWTNGVQDQVIYVMDDQGHQTSDQRAVHQIAL